ncbi:hypothetical protein Tco_0523778 [Tanacetum coccineum]
MYCKVRELQEVDPHDPDCRNHVSAWNQRNSRFYECGCLRHSGGECPISEVPETWDNKSALLLNARLRTRGSLKTLPEIVRINNNNKSRGKTLAGHTLLDWVIRNHMGDLNPCAQSAITTMMVRCVSKVAYNATLCSVTSPGTVREYGNANAVNNQRVTVTSQKIICLCMWDQGALQEGLPKQK